MYTDSQRLGFKISPLDHRYKKKVNESLAESRGSFEGLQTPGWSSLVKSQISEHTERKNPLKHSDIYNKLVELDKIKTHPNQSVNQNQTVDTYQTKNKGIQSSRFHSNPKLSKNKYSKENIKLSSEKAECKEKRWNQISIHQNLYLESHKLENKRIIEKLLDQDFKKKEIFKFHPTINAKSTLLAKSKFERIKEKDELSKQQPAVKQNKKEKEKQSKEVERYRLLNTTFYFLSNGETLLKQNCLTNTLEELPIPCITVLQPILKQLYRGGQLEWVDFLELFNSKTVKQKQIFFTLMRKWLQRRDKNAKVNVN